MDNLCSLAAGSSPRFNYNTGLPTPVPAHWRLSSPLALRYKTKLINLTGLKELSEDTTEAYQLFRHLIAEKDRCDATSNLMDMGITKTEFQSYTDHLIRRFINIIQSPSLESSGPNALIFKLFGYTALAHLMTFLSTPARRGSVLQLMSTRVHEILEVVDVPSIQLAYPEMIIWILVVGGLASHYTDYQGILC